jgi:bifunctional polynucleotide phosphatase/kinase
MVGTHKRLIVSVGAPGSGKSIWAGALAASVAGVVIVNQDTLKTKAKCVAAAAAALQEGKSVIVDATNSTEQVRAEWLQLAADTGAKSAAVLHAPGMRCSLHLNAFRGCCPFQHPGSSQEQRAVPSRILKSMHSSLRTPKAGEGFDLILEACEPPTQVQADSVKVMKMWLA